MDRDLADRPWESAGKSREHLGFSGILSKEISGRGGAKLTINVVIDAANRIAKP
jgi:hypothetical protein